MTRTTIRKTGHNSVTLKHECPLSGDDVERAFWIPNAGGYVREGDVQVCEMLSRRGNTLVAEDQDDLLRLIRAEWRKYRRSEALLIA